MRPVIIFSNFRLRRLLLFVFAYSLLLFFLHNVFNRDYPQGLPLICLLFFLTIAFLFCTHIAVFKFYDSKFEVVCPFRPFSRKASYDYGQVSMIRFYNGKYSSVSVKFKDNFKRSENWSIFADFDGGRETLMKLSAFLSKKGVILESNIYKSY